MLARLRAEGPLTATQLGGAKRGGEWWDWSETKIAVEWLLDVGEAICVRREGWRRVYDLPERVVPSELLDHDPSDAECLAYLAGVATRALGVATRADIIQKLYYRGYVHGDPPEPSETGVTMYEGFKKFVPRMATPDMTAEMEAEMDRIAAGEMTKDPAMNMFRRLGNAMTYDNGSGYLFATSYDGITQL